MGIEEEPTQSQFETKEENEISGTPNDHRKTVMSHV